MALLKDFVARGIYYNKIGVTDYTTWSKNMIDYCGSEIRPYVKDVRKWSIVIQNSLDIDKDVKLNCWQFMGCGLKKKAGRFCAIREPHICPALSEKKLDGVHGGINAGRACWIISYTTCCDAVQGTYEEKYETCIACDFYQSVMEEEDVFMVPGALKTMLL